MNEIIKTEAGTVAIEALPAGVVINGRRIPAHEARMLAELLKKAAERSVSDAAALVMAL